MPLTDDALEPLLRLSLVRGVGPQRFAGLVGRFGSAEGVLSAPEAELARVPGVGPRLAREISAIAGEEGRAVATRARRRMRRVGAVALASGDPLYPRSFSDLADPPFVLFASGDLSLLDAPGLAVVGTRAPTFYGREIVAELSNGAARAGYSVVSGMARGIDTLAHRAALEAGGATVGVLGQGIDVEYPPENAELFAAVRGRGLLITEMPPGERPLAGNFPRRNRLIAALSRGVLVVEMGMKSGAQHTVTYALELGREVMAVPGPVTSHASAGTNQLIKDGARVVTCVQDVLEELGGVGSPMPAPDPTDRRWSAEPGNGGGALRGRREAPEPGSGTQAALELLSAAEGRVLASLGPDPRHVDQLVPGSEIGAGELLGVLLGLELKGVVQALPGKMYRRR